MNEFSSSGQMLISFCHCFRDRIDNTHHSLLHFIQKTNAQDNPFALVERSKSSHKPRGFKMQILCCKCCMFCFVLSDMQSLLWKGLKCILLKNQKIFIMFWLSYMPSIERKALYQPF